MSRDYPFVSIVLPVYNEERYLEECLQSLLDVDYPRDRFEIVTVDNGSTDGSFMIARQYADKCLSMPEVNVGAVRNFGVKHTDGEIIAFLDSDCLVPRTWIRDGVKLMQNNKDHCYGGCLFLREEPYWIEKYWLLQGSSEKLQKDLLGSCTFTNKRNFEIVDGFDESVTSGEDSDFSKKLVQSGVKVVIDKSLGVIHLGNPVSIAEFIKRQIWHAENYLPAIGTSVRDPMFWLVVVFLFGEAGFLMILAGVETPWMFVACSLMLPPALLSTRRVRRSGFKIKTAGDIAGIYLVDVFYLFGRTLGMIKGAGKLLRGIVYQEKR